MYAMKANKESRDQVHKFWENRARYQKARVPSMKRLNTLIGMADWPASEWTQTDKELYALGRVRATDKFFKTFGIHVKEQTVEPHLCQFVKTKDMMQKFLPALRSNRMGLDYDKIDFEFVNPLKK